MASHGTGALALSADVHAILDQELFAEVKAEHASPGSPPKVKVEPGSSSSDGVRGMQLPQEQFEAHGEIEEMKVENWAETVRLDKLEQLKDRLMALCADEAEPLSSCSASRYFSKLLKQTGEGQLECYAKCYRFAKSLEKGPRDNRLKRLGEALEQSHELREAVLNGVLPAPSVEARPVAERKAREHQSRQQKKRNAEEEERKRKRDEFEEEKKAFEEEKSRWEQAQARREEELERRERQILKEESKMQLKVDNMQIEVQRLEGEKRALERFLVAHKRL